MRLIFLVGFVLCLVSISSNTASSAPLDVTLSDVYKILKFQYKKDCNSQAKKTSTTECAALSGCLIKLKESKPFDTDSAWSRVCKKAQDIFYRKSPTPEQIEVSNLFLSAVEAFPDLNSNSILSLIQCIETHLPDWKNQCESSSHRLEFNIACQSYDPLWTDTHIELDHHCENVFFTMKHETLGSGNFKKFHPAFQYRTWKKFARGELINQPNPFQNNSSGKSVELESEYEILRSIARLPHDQRVGLPETVYADHKGILQIKYDEDLSDALRNNIPEKSAVEIIRQLNAGLVNFHKLNLMHSDIKPENIMISSVKNPKNVTAVYNDFGLSYNPKEECLKGLNHLRIRGTPNYISHNQFTFQWPAVRDEAYCETLIPTFQKNDVFAHALVVAQILYQSKTLPWDHCLEDSSPFLSEAYNNCYDLEFNHFLYELKGISSHTPIGQLLYDSLQVNPALRPTSAEFNQRFESLLNQQNQKGWFQDWKAFMPTALFPPMTAPKPPKLDFHDRKRGSRLGSSSIQSSEIRMMLKDLDLDNLGSLGEPVWP